jgi:hypothetical protein
MGNGLKSPQPLISNIVENKIYEPMNLKLWSMMFATASIALYCSAWPKHKSKAKSLVLSQFKGT